MIAPINSVIVLGGGSAGFLAALTLKTMLPELEITIVHSSDLPPIGVGESTTSLIPRFLHAGLGLDQETFYREVRPSWKLGIRFEDWGVPGTSHFYYPFDAQAAARAAKLGKEEAYYYYADQRVFSHYTAMMDLEKSPCFVKPDGTYSMDKSFGYHIENRLLVQYFERVCRQRGIAVIDRKVVDIAMDDGEAIGEDGTQIRAVRFEDGSELDADLFVDCTGFASRLLGGAYGEPFVSYGDSLFCDTAVTGSWQRSEGVLPFTNCETMDHGWCWQIEMVDHVSCGYVFSSKFCTSEEAAQEMKVKHAQLTDRSLGDGLRTVSFRSGRYERFWVKNVAAIGNASGFVEPLESTGLHMIAVTARTLGQALVDNDRYVTESMRYGINQYIATLWDDIRDCLAVHFAFNQCRQTPFWVHCQTETDLAGAKPLVEFYGDNGPSSLGSALLPRNTIFRHDGYLAVLIGQQVPSSYRFEPNAEERQQWEATKHQVRETAGYALPMDDGLRMALGQAE